MLSNMWNDLAEAMKALDGKKIDVRLLPHLRREIKVDVTKCHVCHAEEAQRHGRPARLIQARQPVP